MDGWMDGWFRFHHMLFTFTKGLIWMQKINSCSRLTTQKIHKHLDSKRGLYKWAKSK